MSRRWTVRLAGMFLCALWLSSFARSAVENEDGAQIVVDRGTAINQLKQMMLAMHNHHDINKTFPAAAICDATEKPLLSWRVTLLQFMEEPASQQLFTEFHLDEAWDSPHNRELVAKMPEIYRCPRSKVANDGRTCYVVPRGESTIFPGANGISIREIRDGTSMTITILEVNDDNAVLWTKPDDWMLNLAKPAAGLGGHFGDHFLTAFADGSVHTLKLTIPAKTLQALFTRNGGEPVQVPQD